MIVTDKKIKTLISDISNEHGTISKSEDGNIGYLWYLYSNGNRSTFKPFIYYAEINLLNSLGYINDEEKERMINILKSKLEDDMYVLSYSIMHLRDLRVKERGLYTKDNENYNSIDYLTNVLNPGMFSLKK